MAHKVLIADSPCEFEPFSFKPVVTYHRTALGDDLLSGIKDATIVVTAPTVPLTYEIIKHSAPLLQAIICLGVGTDLIDKRACFERDIIVCNTPAQSADSVAEHAITLLCALRRQILHLHGLTMEGTEWAKNEHLITEWEHPPRTNKDEILGVVGYGVQGKAVHKLATSLGMQILVAERKGAIETRPGRVEFEDVLRKSTVVVLAAPLDDSTRNLVNSQALSLMQKSAYLVNIGRGGLVDERALVHALRNKTIAGAATDVFAHEPATKENSVLLDPTIPNLLLSPHVAWYTKATIDGTKKTVHATVEAFARGQPQNVVQSGQTLGLR